MFRTLALLALLALHVSSEEQFYGDGGRYGGGGGGGGYGGGGYGGGGYGGRYNNNPFAGHYGQSPARHGYGGGGGGYGSSRYNKKEESDELFLVLEWEIKKSDVKTTPNGGGDGMKCTPEMGECTWESKKEIEVTDHCQEDKEVGFLTFECFANMREAFAVQTIDCTFTFELEEYDEEFIVESEIQVASIKNGPPNRATLTGLEFKDGDGDLESDGKAYTAIVGCPYDAANPGAMTGVDCKQEDPALFMPLAGEHYMVVIVEKPEKKDKDYGRYGHPGNYRQGGYGGGYRPPQQGGGYGGYRPQPQQGGYGGYGQQQQGGGYGGGYGQQQRGGYGQQQRGGGGGGGGYGGYKPPQQQQHQQQQGGGGYGQNSYQQPQQPSYGSGGSNKPSHGQY